MGTKGSGRVSRASPWPLWPHCAALGVQTTPCNVGWRPSSLQTPPWRLILCTSVTPQVERLETKVINPLKLYGVQIKQTRVSEGTVLQRRARKGRRRSGLATLGPQYASLSFRLRSRNSSMSGKTKSNNWKSWRN